MSDWTDCKKNELFDIDAEVCIGKNDVELIGDGKTPNKYWISISEDYYVQTGPGMLNWASDKRKLDVKGKTIAVSDKYGRAKMFLEDEFILSTIHANDSPSSEEKLGGIIVRGTTIEDRLSGQIYEYINEEMTKLQPLGHEDIRFTKEALEKKGLNFE